MSLVTSAFVAQVHPGNPGNQQATGHGTAAIAIVVVGVLVVAAVVAFNVMRHRGRSR